MSGELNQMLWGTRLTQDELPLKDSGKREGGERGLIHTSRVYKSRTSPPKAKG